MVVSGKNVSEWASERASEWEGEGRICINLLYPLTFIYDIYKSFTKQTLLLEYSVYIISYAYFSSFCNPW